MSPEKRAGNPGKLEKIDFGFVTDAFVTWLRINQLNADPSMNSRAQFATRLASVFGKKDPDCSLLDRILKETAIDLLASKSKTVEHRQVLWNTFENLNRWFDTWSETLLELGFAYKDELTGKIEIKSEQLKNILNPRSVQKSWRLLA